MVKMNVIDYITITCNLKNGRLQITCDYMKKCNRLQLIRITNYDYPMSEFVPDDVCSRNLLTVIVPDDVCSRNLLTVIVTDDVCSRNLLTVIVPDDVCYTNLLTVIVPDNVCSRNLLTDRT